MNQHSQLWRLKLQLKMYRSEPVVKCEAWRGKKVSRESLNLQQPKSEEESEPKPKPNQNPN